MGKNEEEVTKHFKAWIILNYKTGQFRVIKKLTKLKPSEVAIDFGLDVTLPKPAVMVARGKIELSSAKMADMTLEALEEGMDNL
jgi:hypothetical protein